MKDHMEKTEETKPRPSPAEFMREVRQEVGKVTWPTRREALVSSAMVLIMVFIAAIFFFTVDAVIHNIIRFILGFGGQ